MSNITYKILIVEDNPADQMLAQLALDQVRNGFKFDIKIANTLAEALPLADWADAAVVDLQLPDSTGLDTVLAIKEQSPTLPILILSGDDNLPQIALRAGRYGVAGAIPKASTNDCLASAVAVTLGVAAARIEADRRYRQQLIAVDQMCANETASEAE